MQRRICGSFFLLVCSITTVWSCGYPGSPSHAKVTFTPEVIRPGTVASYECEPGFELLGPPRRVCSSNNTWTPAGVPFCVINVAAGKAPMQSSIAQGAVPENAVDGSTSSVFDNEVCSMTEPERAPWWYVNLLEPYVVQLVRLDFGQPCCGNNKPATIVVRVGNNRPDLAANPICNRFTGFIEEGRPLFLPCNPPTAGAFVSVHLEDSPGNSLSICEAFVYTDQALPIERCPQFRDQEPGSTATYSGKCYMFHDRQRLNFNEARQFCEARGGSLIDETNPALQGFISWELWRRHRGDPIGQYWMGAIRDPTDRNNWKWINGRDVTISFWNLPGEGYDCARFDGTKGWLWSDTKCNMRLFFVCQHRPKSCGRPEQPANSSIIADSFGIGSRIEYLCDPGHATVGPFIRTCLPSGSYSEYPPICKYVQCGLPARITNGAYKLVNGTRHYFSMASYSCADGYQLIGRGDLICDVDGRWNGPPPRCEPVYCLEPPQISNGGFRLSTNSTVAGTVVTYYCQSPRFKLSGHGQLVCQSDGHYDRDAPVCLDNEIADSSNIRTNESPDVNEPKTKIGSGKNESEAPKLNLGGIIALGVFGGFVFLAAMITTFVIVIRRVRNHGSGYQRRSRTDLTLGTGGGSSNHSSGSRPYRSTWDDLPESKRHKSSSRHNTEKGHHAGVSRKETLDDPNFRLRASGEELVVADVYPKKDSSADRKRHHHHHHHHKHSKRIGNEAGEW